MGSPTITYIDLTGRIAKVNAPRPLISVSTGFDDLAALTKAAEVIANRARFLGGTWCNSIRIPIATHVERRGSAVSVVTTGSVAPNAAPFEGGEDHPLWAKKGSWRYLHSKWGQQPFRPYMLTAAQEKIDEAAQIYGESVYAYAKTLGWE